MRFHIAFEGELHARWDAGMKVEDMEAYDTRPHVTEHEKPVDAYTLRPAGVLPSTLPNSLCHWPTLAAVTLPRRLPLVVPAALNAPYPRSSN